MRRRTQSSKSLGPVLHGKCCGRFEREGYELEFHVEERGYAQFMCRIDLPIDMPNGGPAMAEAMVKGEEELWTGY